VKGSAEKKRGVRQKPHPLKTTDTLELRIGLFLRDTLQLHLFFQAF
jgi:hypothetical protein